MSLPEPANPNPHELIFQLAYYSHRLISDTPNIADLQNAQLHTSLLERLEFWNNTFYRVDSILLRISRRTECNLTLTKLSTVRELLHARKELGNIIFDRIDSDLSEANTTELKDAPQDQLNRFARELWNKKSLLEDYVEELRSSAEFFLVLRNLRRFAQTPFSDFKRSLNEIKLSIGPYRRLFWILGKFLNSWREAYLLNPMSCDAIQIRFETRLRQILNHCDSPNITFESLVDFPAEPNFLTWLDRLSEKIYIEISKIVPSAPTQQTSDSVRNESNENSVSLCGTQVYVNGKKQFLILQALVSKKETEWLDLVEIAELIFPIEKVQEIKDSLEKKSPPEMDTINSDITRIRTAIKRDLGLSDTNPILVKKREQGIQQTRWKLDHAKIQTEIKQEKLRQGQQGKSTDSNDNTL